MVDAPIERVWELIGDVSRHPEWWPRVEEVECDLLDVGCTYRQVTRRPDKTIETTISIEQLDDCHQLRLRCLDTGMYADFLLTPAQGGTFMDAELGVDSSILALKTTFEPTAAEGLDATYELHLGEHSFRAGHGQGTQIGPIEYFGRVGQHRLLHVSPEVWPATLVRRIHQHSVALTRGQLIAPGLQTHRDPGVRRPLEKR